MKLTQLKFKKVGNHWYLDIEHNNPKDLVLDPVLEKLLSRIDKHNEGVVENLYLSEQQDYVNQNGLLQFSEKDLLQYFTTSEPFMMTIFINNHAFKISSELYTLLETKYQFDFHMILYRFVVYDI